MSCSRSVHPPTHRFQTTFQRNNLRQVIYYNYINNQFTMRYYSVMFNTIVLTTLQYKLLITMRLQKSAHNYVLSSPLFRPFIHPSRCCVDVLLLVHALIISWLRGLNGRREPRWWLSVKVREIHFNSSLFNSKYH